jgi:DNA-directed RNA polymerase subunit RPC12/RpoP
MTKEVRGKLLKCDRCSEEVLLKFKNLGKTNKYGGDITFENYEPTPEDWNRIKLFSGIDKDLCPRCSEEFNDTWEDFMEEF